MKNLNFQTAKKSAKHVMCVFAAAVLIGEFWAIPTWMRIGYAAALIAAWMLLYRIEVSVYAWMESRRTRTNRPQPREIMFAPAQPKLPEQIARECEDSDAHTQREDDAIAALIDLGYPRSQAAKISRGPVQKKSEKQNRDWIVDFDNHSSAARA